MNGREHIAQVFQTCRANKHAALMPYCTLGYPNPAASLEIVEAIARSGADLVELGVPFSDPLADGPTIQHSTQIALEQGMSVRRCLEMCAELRKKGLALPFLLMGYINRVLAYGVERYAAEAATAGADGLIIPDLPPEEAGQMEAACLANGLALVFLVPPVASSERAVQIASHSSGFVYLVSVTGVTGARRDLSSGTPEFIQRMRQVTQLPLALGFGISTPAQAAAVGNMTDGVIVGSALIDVIRKADGGDPAKAAGEFIASLSQALRKKD
jgi:tryptophan synthase alpha chain